ncbi:hypothetical protein L596_012513 [Steinernema carpocapsae]|uniref:REJ domain-containing protein n=2 Tax=Steinernema carpocapsae TaxID=34508 RepID=A0A4V6A4W4_STECR|nr:hypothetical protein L596_012513 [Steinernema carpocapsae]
MDVSCARFLAVLWLYFSSNFRTFLTTICSNLGPRLPLSSSYSRALFIAFLRLIFHFYYTTIKPCLFQSNCPNDIHFYWSIYDDFNAEIPSALLSKEDKPSSVINGSRIQAKFHRVCLLVKISDSEKSSCGYFTIAENFFAVSFGNLGKSVKMVENDSVFLDPAANTVTSPPLKNITYEWLCRKTGTGEFKPISESGCFKDGNFTCFWIEFRGFLGYQHLPWNRGRVELKNPSTLFKKVPGNYEMKVIARGRRSTEEAIETASEIEISILSQRSEASIDFRYALPSSSYPKRTLSDASQIASLFPIGTPGSSRSATKMSSTSNARIATKDSCSTRSDTALSWLMERRPSGKQRRTRRFPCSNR